MGRELVPLEKKQRIPVSPEIVRKLRSNVTAAYYYTQLIYYDRCEKKDAAGWFSKNTREIEENIGLNRRQQQHSRKILEELGWIETCSVSGGRKPTTMFRVLVQFITPVHKGENR